MSTLSNFPVAKQEGKDSCWACASRMINNYFVAAGKGGANKKIDTDTDLAKLVGLSILKQESAAAVLAKLGYENNTDTAPLPKADEIEEAISEGKPLLAIIAKDPPKNGEPELSVQKGHWMVIIGITISTSTSSSSSSKSLTSGTLTVFDPETGSARTVAYADRYDNGWYWQNTSYVDGQ